MEAADPSLLAPRPNSGLSMDGSMGSMGGFMHETTFRDNYQADNLRATLCKRPIAFPQALGRKMTTPTCKQSNRIFGSVLGSLARTFPRVD